MLVVRRCFHEVDVASTQNPFHRVVQVDNALLNDLWSHQPESAQYELYQLTVGFEQQQQQELQQYEIEDDYEKQKRQHAVKQRWLRWKSLFAVMWERCRHATGPATAAPPTNASAHATTAAGGSVVPVVPLVPSVVVADTADHLLHAPAAAQDE